MIRVNFILNEAKNDLHRKGSFYVSLVALLIPEIVKGMKNISEKSLANCLQQYIHLAATHRTVILLLY